MKQFYILCLCLAASSLGFAQLNIDSLSHIDYNSLHNTQLNDVWGYTDELGNEYALVGARLGVSVVDVTDPTNPQEIFWDDSKYSVWRDIKTYGDYAYVSTEADTGLLVLDLSGLPNSTNIPTYHFGGEFGTLHTSHNLWIDENGILYVFGSNILAGGVQMYDLNTSATSPDKVGEFEDWYCHDGYVRNDTAYFGHIYDGFFTVVDVSDKSNPIILGSKATPTSFSHNIWLSDDGNTVFTTDEVTNSYVASYDVSNPSSIVELDRIQSNPGTKTIPHNAHVLGDFVITSYYADGVVIHDASDPENLIEVGNYDTYPGTSTSTNGNWGAYPYFTSGNLIVTDIDHGFFVLGPNYTLGAKLQGVVTNEQTAQTLSDVEITIENHNQVELTELDGSYKTGISHTGQLEVDYFRYSFVPKTITVDFQEGQTITEDVELTPLSAFDLTVQVEDQQGNAIFGADIKLSFPQIELTDVSNGAGEASFTLYYEDDYELIVGKWGYKTVCNNYYIDPNTQTIVVVLEEGIYDDFTFDFGWTTSGSADAGQFLRAVPVGKESGGLVSQVFNDSPYDCGEEAYVTGNGELFDYVTNGSVNLYSPVFDLTGYSDPHINYSRFFFCFYGPFEPDDTLKIYLSNGIVNQVIDMAWSEIPQNQLFYNKSIRVLDYMQTTANMQLRVFTSDIEPSGNVTEVVFDNFSVTNQSLSGVDEAAKQSLSVYPNPTKGRFTIESPTDQNLKITDAMGRVVKELRLKVGENLIDMATLEGGIYFLTTDSDSYKLILKK